ncbi:uncharacterized protein RAG0_06292 [Rhynchosporium agropyri]|uniref:Uncharacterized protein n=2 Tax=Rhynchosporium TaxID=38037 RepID=A0A1E1MPR8_RHYSE|nr:uncharacterized protein RAG0_06292 [Rhynchosporium agropyri]CZT51094.1 uncharacterized protein RSE6_12180 [Rhynchosporium secalis]
MSSSSSTAIVGSSSNSPSLPANHHDEGEFYSIFIDLFPPRPVFDAEEYASDRLRILASNLLARSAAIEAEVRSSTAAVEKSLESLGVQTRVHKSRRKGLDLKNRFWRRFRT